MVDDRFYHVSAGDCELPSMTHVHIRIACPRPRKQRPYNVPLSNFPLFYVCPHLDTMLPILLLALASAILAFPTSGTDGQVSISVEPQQAVLESPTTQGWYDPREHGGSMIDVRILFMLSRFSLSEARVDKFTTRYYGEPLNVIISALSDPFVLTETGFNSTFLSCACSSIGFSEECLGLHVGDLHRADLGDGEGKRKEQILARQYYFPVWGTCWESFIGGNHFRAWKQNGTLANSGAWFLAASKEKDSGKNHMIEDDGYNVGRNWLVERAAAGTHWNSMWWRADVEWNESDMLMPGRQGINHGIRQDGRVAILTVRRL